MGYKRDYGNPFYIRMKKHFCPACSTKMDVIQCYKEVKSNSKESKDWDLSIGRARLIGDVTIVWDEFKCPNCNMQVSAEAMKAYEEKQKREKTTKR